VVSLADRIFCTRQHLLASLRSHRCAASQALAVRAPGGLVSLPLFLGLLFHYVNQLFFLDTTIDPCRFSSKEIYVIEDWACVNSTNPCRLSFDFCFAKAQPGVQFVTVEASSKATHCPHSCACLLLPRELEACMQATIPRRPRHPRPRAPRIGSALAMVMATPTDNSCAWQGLGLQFTADEDGMFHSSTMEHWKRNKGPLLGRLMDLRTLG
jgi:hypothetical protein